MPFSRLILLPCVLAGLIFSVAPAARGAVYSGIPLRIPNPGDLIWALQESSGFANVYVISFGDDVYLGLNDDGRLTHIANTIADGFIWFPVQKGEAVDAALLIGGSPVLHGDTAGKSIQTTWDEEFYWGGVSLLNNGQPVPGYSRYAWILLRTRQTDDGPILELLANAVEDTGFGIRAGSYFSIPEPAAVAFLMVAGLVAGNARRRRLGAAH